MLVDVSSSLTLAVVMLMLCSEMSLEDVLCKTDVSRNDRLPTVSPVLAVVGNLDAKYSAR